MTGVALGFKDGDIISPPWTKEQVQNLNTFQLSGWFHPFTCRDGRTRFPHRRRPGEGDYGILVATSDGWVCRDCDYTQHWAWPWMAEKDWTEDPSPWPPVYGGGS